MEQSESLLPGLFGAFALSSFLTSTTMLIKPEFGWRMYGVSSEKRSLTGILYASAMFGEGVLQSCACMYPQGFLGAAIMFMVPYKLVSAVSLLSYAHSIPSPRERHEIRWVVLQWLAPVALIVATVRMEARQLFVLEA